MTRTPLYLDDDELTYIDSVRGIDTRGHAIRKVIREKMVVADVGRTRDIDYFISTRFNGRLSGVEESYVRNVLSTRPAMAASAGRTFLDLADFDKWAVSHG